jgi:hypothetical protein
MQRGAAAASPLVNDTSSLHYVKIGEIVGELRRRIGDVDGAIDELRQVLVVASRRYAANDPRLAEVQNALGDALVAGHHDAEATPLLDAAAATFERRYGAANPQTIAARRDAEQAHR